MKIGFFRSIPSKYILIMLVVTLQACGGDRKVSVPSAKGFARENPPSGNENKVPEPTMVDLFSGMISVMRGTRFYDALYRVKASVGVLKCQGDLPVRISLPEPGGSIFDFHGSELKCFGISLPIDKILSSLFTGAETGSTTDPASPVPAGSSNDIVLGIKNANGLIGLTKIMSVDITPYYPLAPDLLSTDGKILSQLNTQTNVTLNDPAAGVTENGQVNVKMNQFDAPFISENGLSLPLTMTWQVSSTGFQRKILGPHLLEALDVGLSKDPLALTTMKFRLPLISAGGAAAVSIGGSKNLSWLSGLGKLVGLLKDTALGKLAFEMSFDLLEFVDGAAPGTPPTN